MVFANLFFRMAALLPLPFLALSPFLGGSWAFVTLFYLTIFAFLADESLMASTDVNRHPGRVESLLADSVPVILGFAHLALLPIAILTVSHGALGTGEKVMIFLAFGLFFGTISTANAHELIHRPDTIRHTLGKWIFTSLLFGHHTSAHLIVHHRHAATPNDPNSARLNEGVYRFFFRAWRGSFRAGLDGEIARLSYAGRGASHFANPYFFYCTGALVFLALSVALAGWFGLIIYVGFAGLAQTQLLLSDYVQHYGLERRILPSGKYEPVSIYHSWNAPHVFSSALMLNAPKHSDHHAHPTIRYSDLRSRASEGAPVLPYSLPVMSCLALSPKIWKRVMNPKVADWVRMRDQDFALFRPTIGKNPV